MLTGIDDLVIVAERHSGVLPFPLWSLDVQVPFLYGERGDSLVVGCVKLRQVLGTQPGRK